MATEAAWLDGDNLGKEEIKKKKEKMKKRFDTHRPSHGRSCPSQAPQSAHREDDGDERGHAERDDRPDEEEAAGGLGDLAVMCPRHVEDGNKQPKERPEEYYDVPRSPSGEH